MRILKRLAGFLGLARDEDQDQEDQEEQEPENQPRENDVDNRSSRPRFQETGLPRRGFSVQVAVDRPNLPPLISPCPDFDGGVQGLRWYAKRLRIDTDGDVADEFLEEILSAPSNVNDPNKPHSRFRVNYSTRPAKIRKQIMSEEGKIQQCLEHQGNLQCV